VSEQLAEKIQIALMEIKTGINILNVTLKETNRLLEKIERKVQLLPNDSEIYSFSLASARDNEVFDIAKVFNNRECVGFKVLNEGDVTLYFTINKIDTNKLTATAGDVYSEQVKRLYLTNAVGTTSCVFRFFFRV